MEKGIKNSIRKKIEKKSEKIVEITCYLRPGAV